jgi:hypothetical protein
MSEDDVMKTMMRVPSRGSVWMKWKRVDWMKRKRVDVVWCEDRNSANSSSRQYPFVSEIESRSTSYPIDGVDDDKSQHDLILIV